MRPISIATDSAADLPADLVRELDIAIVPLVLVTNGNAWDETDLTRDEFWELFRRSGGLKTSQPSVGAFTRIFQRLVDLGYDVLYLSVTSRHSGTLSTARLAAQQFRDRVLAVDTLSVSLAQGLQVLTAARLARMGAAMGEILDAVRSVRERSHVRFQLRTLEYLRRGGRAAALLPAVDRVAQVLSLCAVLTVQEGELRLSGVARTYTKGLQRMKNELARLAPLEWLAVAHSRVPEVAHTLAQELAALTQVPPDRVLVNELGATLSCHGGEGLIGAVGVSRK